MFSKSVVLTQVMRQSGQDCKQVRFQDILLRLRDASVTKADWECLMTRRDGQVTNKDCFRQALNLLPIVNAVAEHKAASQWPTSCRDQGHSQQTKVSHCNFRRCMGLDPVVHIATHLPSNYVLWELWERNHHAISVQSMNQNLP